jgi:hypothetical protein
MMSTAFLDAEAVTRMGDEDPSRRRSAVADRFAALVSRGSLDLPSPGSGRTRERWARLTTVAEHDLVLVRLAEGHADALAILEELGVPHPGTDAWGGASAADRPE